MSSVYDSFGFGPSCHAPPPSSPAQEVLRSPGSELRVMTPVTSALGGQENVEFSRPAFYLPRPCLTDWLKGFIGICELHSSWHLARPKMRFAIKIPWLLPTSSVEVSRVTMLMGTRWRCATRILCRLHWKRQAFGPSISTFLGPLALFLKPAETMATN